jgi:hypothetical protein
MAHKKHSWTFWSVELEPGRNRINAAHVHWTCRCGKATERTYNFRKPSPTAETAGTRERTLLQKELAQWPNQELLRGDE